MSNYSEFVINLFNKIMQEHRLTKVQLAQKLQMKFSLLDGIIDGDYNLPSCYIARIKDVFNVDIKELYLNNKT